MKKWISLLLFITLVFSIGATSFAQINDISTHWANREINYLIDRGALNGYPDGSFKPNNPMTKVEFYKIINELLNFTEIVDVNYLDVQESDWFYNHVSIALAAGYIRDAILLSPNENITRQDVVKIIGKVYNLNEQPEAANKFIDSELITQEIKGYIGVLFENNLLQGYPDGTFRPAENITRAEVVKLIYNVLGKIDNLPIKETVNKSELQKLINDVESLKKSGYTNSTWEKLTNALQTAIDVLNNNAVKQTEVDDVAGELLEAIDNLKRAHDVTSRDRDYETPDKEIPDKEEKPNEEEVPDDDKLPLMVESIE